jgi:hypothetical protein
MTNHMITGSKYLGFSAEKSEPLSMLGSQNKNYGLREFTPRSLLSGYKVTEEPATPVL